MFKLLSFLLLFLSKESELSHEATSSLTFDDNCYLQLLKLYHFSVRDLLNWPLIAFLLDLINGTLQLYYDDFRDYSICVCNSLLIFSTLWALLFCKVCINFLVAKRNDVIIRKVKHFFYRLYDKLFFFWHSF